MKNMLARESACNRLLGGPHNRCHKTEAGGVYFMNSEVKLTREYMRTLPAKLSFAALLLLCSHATALADSIDDYVTLQMQKRHIPGLSLAVIKDGKVVKMRGYGLASVELGTPATENSVYQIASITKSFTATAIMRLAEDGKLGLEDKITKHLDGLPATWGEITIRHLLTHTSGLVSDPVPWSLETVGRPYTREELLKIITGAPLQFPPGTMYRYANSDYYLLALIIEKVSGKSYGEFLSERIFTPLGMTATRVNDPWEVVPGRVGGYGWEHDKLNIPPPIHPSQTLGSGNLLSTVVDLAKFDAALTGGRILKKTSLEQMWAPAKINGEEIGYGLGWTIYDYRGHKSWGMAATCQGLRHSYSALSETGRPSSYFAVSSEGMTPLTSSLYASRLKSYLTSRSPPGQSPTLTRRSRRR